MEACYGTLAQIRQSWNTCVKLVYNVPISTYTYLVEGFLAMNMVSMRNKVMSQYSGFFRKLLASPCREVCGLARIVAEDPRSNTCQNLRLVSRITGLNRPYDFASFKFRSRLPTLKVPDAEV